MLTGYSREEVEAIPQMSKDVLGGYYNQVSEAIRDYLNKTEMEELEKPSIGFEGRQPNWFWVRHPLLDMTRHVGEMLALKGQWEREMGLGLDTS
jgi:hypothetical protein